MRVHVDAEKCQGHNRCYALAPELFEIDDFGNATELGDGVVPPTSRTRPGSPSANCPEYAISIDGGSVDDRQPPAGHRLGHRLRPHRPGVGRRPVPDLGRAAGRRARSPTPTATAACGCPTRHDDVAAIAYDTEHFTSRSVVVTRAGPIDRWRRSGIAPPISSDPPFHHEARRLLLPAFSPKAIDELEPSTRDLLQRADRRRDGQGRRRRRRRLRPAHPGAGDRQHARLPAGGRRPVPRLRPRRRSRASTSRRGAHRELRASSSTTSAPRSRTTSPTPATTSPRSCSTPSSTASSSTRPRRAARSCCC